MVSATELLKQGRRDEFWQRYCGFFDLTSAEFVAIQERLLIEQLQLLSGSKLGRQLVGGVVPRTLNDFRRVVPFTTYDSYVPHLTEQREDMLAVKPTCWARTSGTTGDSCKWVPISPEHYKRLARSLMTALTLAGAKSKGDVIVEEGSRLLYVAAPPPFITGITMRAVNDEFPLRFIPPVDEAEKLPFQERVQKGFAESVGSGLDYFAGLASILMRIGDAFTQGSRQMKFSATMLQPSVISRLLTALVKSKLEGRGMLPKDIWQPKGIIAGGMDLDVYREPIRKLWGQSPLELYGCTEFGTVAVQAWGIRKPGLTLVPDSAFWEFLPENEYATWRTNPAYRPETLLLNELKPGRYVLVGTSLSGGAFVRYVIGDLIRVLSPKNEELGIDLPQIAVESRADSTINLGSMVVLTERSIWEAIGHADLRLINWVAQKEDAADGHPPVVAIYGELDAADPTQLSTSLHEALIETNEDYAGAYEIMRINPIKVKRLTPGTLAAFMEEKQAEGADPGRLKPPRLQPPPEVFNRLLAISARLDRNGK
jgi:hypothetical protein